MNTKPQGPMTWGELKKALDEQGVPDNAAIDWIEVCYPRRGQRFQIQLRPVGSGGDVSVSIDD